MAQSRHRLLHCTCPLLGVQRTLFALVAMAQGLLAFFEAGKTAGVNTGVNKSTIWTNQFTDSAIRVVCMAKRNRLSPAKFIDANRWRVTEQDAAQRFAERDIREAADIRTPAQRWLNDPPPDRSALAQMAREQSPRNAAGMRVDLWRK